MIKIDNPVLTGFNPDPCLFKGKDAYYILVSTFEFVPGIRVYESYDLANWKYKTSILTDADLTGNGRGCSVWAPFATYHDGKYYVVYTDVKSTRVPFKDVNNYIVTSDSIFGPWSVPKYINSSGFDPSIFFDNEKLYFLNEYWDYRLSTHNKSAGILIQEMDPKKLNLINEPKILFNGTKAAKTEAPQIYKHGDYYYLVTAEGGTEVGHMVTVARSKKVTGPYEVDPQNPMLTAKNDSNLTLQCSGHASIVKGLDDSWFMAHLMTRPLEEKYPILGRETSIQNVEWTKDGWLRLTDGSNEPNDYYEVNDDVKVNNNSSAFIDNFSKGKLDFEKWSVLRKMPSNDWMKFTQNGIKIYGGQSVQSTFDQHLIGTRQKDFKFSAETEVFFEPTNYMQLAGMGLYLDVDNYVMMMITTDEKIGKCVILMKAEKGEFSLIGEPIKVNGETCFINVDVNDLCGRFSIKENEKETCVKDNIDLSFLSGGFTGNFVVLDVIDMSQTNKANATFKSFSYKN